jgi:hypothetical protein
MSDSDHDAYTVGQFAARHGISRSQTYVEIASGRLVARKVNSRTVITREDAARWRRSLPKMQANTVVATA